MQSAPNGQQPVYIMQKGTEQTNGSVAQRNNIMASKAVAEAVKTTLGPLGMDKMLIDQANNILITNDGVTILREIGIEHPAAKMIVEVAKTQESRCYDGTTSSVVLAGALLSKAEVLLDKGIHPTTIIKGYRLARDFCIAQTTDLSRKVIKLIEDEQKKGSPDIAFFSARTSLTGKSAEGIQDQLATLAKNVVLTVDSIEDIKYVPASGTSEHDTHLVNGVVIERDLASPSMNKQILGSRILLLDCAIEPKKTNIDAQVQITSPSQIEDFLLQEEESIKEMVQRIKESGSDVVFTQKKIDDLALHYLNKEKIVAIHSVKKSDLESIARISKATIVSSLSKEVDASNIGQANFFVNEGFDYDLIEITTEEKSPINTIVACGATRHVAEEIERALEDAIGVAWLTVKEHDILLGGGSTHASLHSALMKDCTPGGRIRMAVEAFAEALLEIPSAIAENAGLDAVDEIIDLLAQSRQGNIRYCIGVEGSSGGDAVRLGIFEPAELHRQAITSATEASIMILRIDDVIKMNAPSGGPPMM